MSDMTSGRRMGAWPLWAKIALIGSIGVNLFFAGIFIGSSFQPSTRSKAADRQIQRVITYVPDHRKSFAEEHFAPVRERIIALNSQRRELAEPVIASIKAEPYSPEAFLTAVSQRRAISDERRDVLQREVANLLESFNAEERSEFATRLGERLRSR